MANKESDKPIKLTPLTPGDALSRSRGKYLTIDKSRRLALSAGLRKELNKDGTTFSIYVGYNVDRKVLAICNSELYQPSNCALLKVDKRGYTNGKGIVDKLSLDMTKAPIRFEDIGKIHADGIVWRAFRLTGEDK